MDNGPLTIQELLDAFHGFKTELKPESYARFESIETKLITAFQGSEEARAGRIHEVNLNEYMAGVRHKTMLTRMAALEDRMLNLETHRR